MHRDYRSNDDNLVAGRNAVSEALRSGRTMDKVFVASGDNTDHGLRRTFSVSWPPSS